MIPKGAAAVAIAGAGPISGLLARALGASVALALNLAYYVTFVQLSLFSAIAGDAPDSVAAVGAPLGLLTIGGAISALVAGVLLDRARAGPRAVAAGAAFVSALLAILAPIALPLLDRAGPIVVACAFGVPLGVQTVLLLGLFSTQVPARLSGIFAGALTAVTYLAANLVAGYGGDPARVALVDGIFALVAAVILSALAASPARNAADADVEPMGRTVRRLVLACLPIAAIVAVDSFMFRPMGDGVIEPPVFASGLDWAQNGVLHVIAASIAGLFLFRVGPARMLMISGALVVAVAGASLVHVHFGAPRLVFAAYSALVGAYHVLLFVVIAVAAPPRARYLGAAAAIVVAGFFANPLGLGASHFAAPRLAFAAYYGIALACAVTVFGGCVFAARRIAFYAAGER
ncbi:hypothetical protein K8I61_15820 [bacterium]|nr:hypothetical protein [bacterium]